MKKILITGTKGFIGKNLLNFVRDKFRILEINEDIFHFENWDNELETLLNNFQPDIIFHIGACSNTMETDVNYIMKVNFEFTKILVDWVVKNNKKIIYSSSAANYGINQKYPANLYAWSKYTAEQYVISNNGIALRYYNVYGPGEEHKGNMASIAYQFYKKNKEGKDCKLFLKNPLRDFIYVDDVVSANLYALDNYNSLSKKYYDVGTGEANSFEKVLNIGKVSCLATSKGSKWNSVNSLESNIFGS